MSTEKTRYTDDELVEFDGLLDKKLSEAHNDLKLLEETREDATPSKPDEMEALSPQDKANLIMRQEKFIRHLEDAKARIKNKTYGICRVTGRLISKERLRLVPHATLSIEAKQQAGK